MNKVTGSSEGWLIKMIDDWLSLPTYPGTEGLPTPHNTILFLLIKPFIAPVLKVDYTKLFGYVTPDYEAIYPSYL